MLLYIHINFKGPVEQFFVSIGPKLITFSFYNLFFLIYLFSSSAPCRGLLRSRLIVDHWTCNVSCICYWTCNMSSTYATPPLSANCIAPDTHRFRIISFFLLPVPSISLSQSRFHYLKSLSSNFRSTKVLPCWNPHWSTSKLPTIEEVLHCFAIEEDFLTRSFSISPPEIEIRWLKLVMVFLFFPFIGIDFFFLGLISFGINVFWNWYFWNRFELFLIVLGGFHLQTQGLGDDSCFFHFPCFVVSSFFFSALQFLKVMSSFQCVIANGFNWSTYYIPPSNMKFLFIYLLTWSVHILLFLF